MRSSKSFIFFIAAIALLYAMGANAAGVDMNDPRRALGREDDVRIDAQLSQDTLSPSTAFNVTYQIQNLSDAPIAIADRISDVSYDPEMQTITMSIGSEIPAGDGLPHLVVIQPGEKKTLTAGGMLRVHVQQNRGPYSIGPRYVQIKVSVLRDITAFEEAIRQQNGARVAAMTDQLFDRWLEHNDSIFLNPIPVRWQARGRGNGVSAEHGMTAATGGRW